jgi:hypothetical protein
VRGIVDQDIEAASFRHDLLDCLIDLSTDTCD